ncbi:MAG: tetratricopeptide repeat protein [Gemmatimonadota bacterium]
MERSGLPECAWMAGLEVEIPELGAIEEHTRTCDVCRARAEYARKHGPRMPGAMGVLTTVMSPTLGLRPPLRSAFFGFLMVLVFTGIPIGYMLVVGLATMNGELLTGSAGLLGVTLVGGGAGGLTHHYTGTIRRSGTVGYYVSWILTMYGYFLGILMAAGTAAAAMTGTSLGQEAAKLVAMSSDTAGLVIWLVMGGVFGVAMGKGMRDTHDGLEPETESPADRTPGIRWAKIGTRVALPLLALGAFALSQWGPAPTVQAPPTTPENARAALPALKAAADSLPDDPQALYNYGMALSQAGDDAGALDILGRAVDLAPRDPSIANAYGWSLTRVGRMEESIPYFRRAVEEAPRYEAAVLNLAWALANQSELDEAASLYRRALEISDGNPGAHEMLARILAHQGRFDEALTHIEKATALDTMDAAFEATYARVVLGLGREDEALEHYRRAAHLDPDEPWYWRELARMAHMMARYEEADHAFARVDELLPDHFDSIAEDRRLWEEARAAMERVGG